MHDDDLRTPLKPRSRWQRLWEKRPTPARAAMALTGTAFGALVVWAVMTPMPEQPQTVASAPVKPVDPVATGSTAPAKPETVVRRKMPRPKDDGAGVDYDVLPQAQRAIPDAASLPRSSREANRRRMAALGLVMDRPLPAAPIRAVSERTKSGVLPRVSRSGKAPWKIYAKPVPRKVLLSSRPKIAIVIGGLGINPALTARAVRDLPGSVTLAYAPYGARLQRQINAARRKGHEVMLQVPMEPWGYPAVNPGPRTLLTSAGDKANLASLRWIMSRAQGYVGLVNYAGQKFLANGEALAPILHEIKRRGLIFLDDGSARQSLLPSLASVISLPARQAAMRIDADSSPEAIGAALDQLVKRARASGSAIGTGTAFDTTLRGLRNWLEDEQGRGDFILVPLSAIYKQKGRG